MSQSTPAPTSSAEPEPSRRARAMTFLSRETTGGALLVGAALLALLWANSAWGDAYVALTEYTIGPAALNLDLSLASWAADGALAVFFFIVGLELKHELTVGSLRDRRAAAVPVLAAIGGMIVPALVYVAVVTSAGRGDLLGGWAIPAATDIAFALAVLAIFGRGLPAALRVFLLTLAVVDDLLAVSIIALFYTDDLAVGWLLAALVTTAVFAYAARARRARVAVMLPLSVLAWVFMHESGVHATIAGVLLGLVVPATAVHDEGHSRVHWLEHLNRPLSAAVALPVFAFFAAGVRIVGEDAGLSLLGEPVTLAIVGGLLLGKLVGVVGGTALAVRLPGLRLADGLSVRDVVPVAFLAAIGFTVSLLIVELSFDDAATTDTAKAAVLVASVLAAALAAVVMRLDARRHASMDAAS